MGYSAISLWGSMVRMLKWSPKAQYRQGTLTMSEISRAKSSQVVVKTWRGSGVRVYPLRMVKRRNISNKLVYPTEGTSPQAASYKLMPDSLLSLTIQADEPGGLRRTSCEMFFYMIPVTEALEGGELV